MLTLPHFFFQITIVEGPDRLLCEDYFYEEFVPIVSLLGLITECDYYYGTEAVLS